MSGTETRTKLRAVFLASLMFLWLFAGTMGFAGSAVAEETIIVDDDGSEDHETIQDAVDAADEGDTIEVEEGTYEESVTIETDDLTLNVAADTEAVHRVSASA
ncbi:MAG: pectinesterase family protein, partial [Natronomonas sp.]